MCGSNRVAVLLRKRFDISFLQAMKEEGINRQDTELKIIGSLARWKRHDSMQCEYPKPSTALLLMKDYLDEVFDDGR